MIVIAGTNDTANVLHLVTGPESDFWTDLHGASIANITEALNRFDSNKPVFLHMTKCVSEDDTNIMIKSLLANGVTYPFNTPTNVYMNGAPGDEDADFDFSSSLGSGAESEDPPSRLQNVELGEAISSTQLDTPPCGRCGTADAELVPKLDPPICYGCVNLDMYLARHRDKNQLEQD